MQTAEAIFYVAILILSVVIHEVAHGFAAYREGDNTAKLAGRLTLNPIKHIDVIGSVVVPLILALTHAPFLFGWAKPVPYNPHNFRNRRRGTVIVAAAGVLTNFFIAILFSLVIRFAPMTPELFTVLSTIVLLNILLGLFNLVPIPPLDGSKILFALLPSRFAAIEHYLERYSFVLVIIFIIFGWQLITPLIYGLFSLLTGVVVQ